MLSRLSAWFGTRPKTMETQDVRLPPDLPNWSTVKKLLQDIEGQLINESISEQETGWSMQTVYNTIQSERQFSGSGENHLFRLRQQIQSNVKKPLDHNCLWFGMIKYLRKISKDEKEKFLYSTLPNIIKFALRIEDCRPKAPLYTSRQQLGGSTKLSRQFVCSIVSCFFLCLFPERKRGSSNMNIVNFTAFFKYLPSPAQMSKLQCVLNYFDCVAERGMEIPGDILFCRKMASLNWMLTFDDLVHCDLKLCPLHVQSEGTIADSGAGTIQVCFGNKSVGGGVLGRSTVQEEILFITCPELMAAMLFMENMEANEAILVSGFEQFSSYSGYGDSLEFAGRYYGTGQVLTMVTIDAASYKEASVNKQYEESSVLRDMNKAIIGFSWMPGTDSGTMQPWDNISGEDETTGAVDVVADIVISAMTDALQQAAESPVDSQQSSHHLIQHPCCQHPNLPQQQPDCLSCQQNALQLSENVNIVSPTHPQTAQSLQQLLFAEPFHPGQMSLDRAVQTVQSTLYQSASSTLPSSSVNYSDDSSLTLEPLLSMAESAITATNSSAQTLVQGLHSSYIQQLEQSVFPEREEKCPELKACSSAEEHLIASSSTPNSLSGRTCHYEDDFGAAAESSALNRDSLTSQSRLASDILGNLSKIHTSHAGVPILEHSSNETDEYCTFVHFSTLCCPSELSGQPQKQHSCPCSADNITDIVVDLTAALKDNTADILSYPSQLYIGKTESDDPTLLQNLKMLSKDKYEDIVNSFDVVLSLPALQSELERVSSGLSISSPTVSVDYQSLSITSVKEESIRQPTAEVLSVTVENNELPLGAWSDSREKFTCDARVFSNDSVLLEPQFSCSPQSSVSSTNISPNSSFFTPESLNLEPPNGSSDMHVTADFLIPGLDGLNSQAQQFSRRGSRDFYGELRDFLNSSSSGSRSSGPISSTNSSWGSRSGSISSHGTNGSSIDFPDFWSHFRRRSSQLSDAMSRRSSSSKHSSDFSTDLEEISEGVHIHNHGVIEEEGSFLSLVADFASHYVSVAVSNGLVVGAHLTSSASGEDEMNRSQVEAPKLSPAISYNRPQVEAARLSPEISDKKQLNAGVKVIDGIYPNSFTLETATINRDRPSVTFSQREENVEPEVSLILDYRELPLPSLAQQSDEREENSPEISELVSQPANLSFMTSSPASQLISISKPLLMPALLSPKISQPHEAATSLRDHQFGSHPSSSRSLDSGLSSTISSATLISKHKKKVESGSEGACGPSRINSSVTKLEGLCSLTNNVYTHSLAPQAVSQVLRNGLEPNTSSQLSLKNDIPESTAGKLNIPCSKTDNRARYATLDASTGSEDFSKYTSMLGAENSTEQMQPESASCEMNTSFFPINSVHHQKTEYPEKINSKKPNFNVSEQSKLPKSLSTDAYEGQRGRHTSIRIDNAENETLTYLEIQSKQHMGSDSYIIAEDTCNSSQHMIPPSLGGAITPSKTSRIPKFMDYVKKLSGYSESSTISRIKTKKTISLSVKDVQKVSGEKKQGDRFSSVHRSTTVDTNLLKVDRSRYIFSDVAAPLYGKQKKSKTATSETFIKKQSEKRAEKKRKHKGNLSKQDQLCFTRSPKFIRFVNAIAEMSVSQAVLEGAEILTHSSGSQEEISDELYNWFATKIVTEVFLCVISELDMQQSDKSADISQAQDSALCDDFDTEDQQSLANRKEMDRTEAAVLKPKSILPTRSDTPAAGSKGLGQFKPLGSLKMVKFKDNRGEEVSSLALPHLQTNVTTSRTNATTTFQRQSSSIPVPIRWRNSLDFPSSSSAHGAHVISFSSSKSPLKFTSTRHGHVCVLHHPSLTSKDMSIDIYQAAASIVNQVFQAVSDSFDVQTPSPVSSGQHGIVSSSDTALHSTGSRINSSYDSIASNIFSSSSTQVSDSPKQALHSVSPSIGVFSRKPMSRETLTNAFLKVDSTPSIKSYERRSSEPCQTSVQLSLQAFNSIKFSKQAVEDKHRKISQTDDDIGRGQAWRRGSLDGFSFERRNSCGFKDPVLSRFAEELMKADTSVPELVIVGSHRGSSSTGSRRSSVCANKESGQANLESELLNTSFTSVCSLPMSHSPRSQCRKIYMDRSRSRESRTWKSDSSDTEYWFPPPKIVGDEFQQEYNRQHSQEEIQDYASFFAGRVVQEAVCVLRCDPTYMSREEQDVELFAENLMDQILRDALITSIRGDGGHRLCSERGDNSLKQSSLTPATLTNDSGDAQQNLFYVKGARPKTSVWTPSKLKTIPQRRDIRCERKIGDMSRHEGSHRKRRASVACDLEKLACQPQQFLCASPHPSVSSFEDSSQHIFHQSHPKNTADHRPSQSRLKRHSCPGPFQLSSSLAKDPSTILSQYLNHPWDKKKPRNKQESANSSISSNGDSISNETSLLRKESYASSASSCHSEHPGSPLPSSSGSEGIGPTGTETPKKHKTKRGKASHQVKSTKLPSTHERSRQRNSYTKHFKKQSKQDGALHSALGMEECPAIDELATSLSRVVMENALQHFRDSRWLKFLSYKRTIATGNWGCGAYRGNAQLKLIIQWLAASVGQAPLLMYYTFGDRRLVQAQQVATLISGWTVGYLATALRDYCNWIHLNLASLPLSSYLSSSARLQSQHQPDHTWQDEQDSRLPQTLFDFLLEKFPGAG